jgi:hypothetical protein
MAAAMTICAWIEFKLKHPLLTQVFNRIELNTYQTA